MSDISMFMVIGAVNSVAMEHPQDCDCTTCRAASGDQEALDEVFRSIRASEEVRGK